MSLYRRTEPNHYQLKPMLHAQLAWHCKRYHSDPGLSLLGQEFYCNHSDINLIPEKWVMKV